MGAELHFRGRTPWPTIAAMIRHAANHSTTSASMRWPGLPRPVRLVLLAADGRPDNRAVVDRAIAVAAREHAELVALHVLPPNRGSRSEAGDGPVPPELDRIVVRARAADVRARYLVRSGDPAVEILRTARGLNADLIVIGTHAPCGHITLHNDRPVLVVQPWAEADPGWDEAPAQALAQPPAMRDATGTLAKARSAAVEEAGEDILPVVDNRVACPLLGGVELERCLECDHLIRLESDMPGSSTARHVICLHRGSDFGDDIPW